MAAYASAKAGLIGLTQVIAAEFGAQIQADLKKYAEEASKAAKSFQENKQKTLDQGGIAPAIGGDDSGSGKGDLQLPAQ